MECRICGKDFGDNKNNYDKHMGSKAHLSRLYDKVAVSPSQQLRLGGGGGVGTPPTPDAGGMPVVLPVPTPSTGAVVVKTIPGVGEVVQRPDGTWMTREAQELYQRHELAVPSPPSQPVPWRKYAVTAGIVLVLVVGIYMAVNAGRRQSTAAAPVAMPRMNGMENFIPPALMSLVAFVFLSKMLRGEFTGWNKIVRELAK